MLTHKDLIADIDACELAPGQVAYWWLGQMGYVLKIGRTVLYIDAYLSPKAKRTIAPFLDPSECTNATAFLGSHDHSDHIDRPAWPSLAAAAPDALFVVPEIHREKVAAELGIAPARMRGVDTGISTRIGEVTIHAVASAHELLVERDGLHPFIGFVIEGNGVCVYHTGDTCIYEGLQSALKRWRFDIAFVPINGRDAPRLARNCLGNMTFQEAVDLAGAIEPGLTVPGHFEMFPDNCEDPQKFADYLRVKFPHLAFAVPRHGERALVTARR